MVIAAAGRVGLSFLSSLRSVQMTTVATPFPLWFGNGFLSTSNWDNSRVPSLILRCTSLRSTQHSMVGCCTKLCKRQKRWSLHSSLVGSLETWLGLKTPSAIHLSRRASSSFRVHGSGGKVSYSLLSDFHFHSPVDTAMAYGVFLLSELSLTDWAVFMAFCNNCAN